jgi:hypothetical protein
LGRPPEKGGIFFKKNLGINPRQPDGKGQKKKKRKTLVLTLGSPLEKGGKKKKKNLGINPGQPAGKGRGKRNPGINPG